MPLRQLKHVLGNYNRQKFRVKEKPGAFEITASTFTDLKRLANLCLNAFGKRPLMVEPERQLLLGQDWSYFDAFRFFQGKPVKSNALRMPDLAPGLLPAPVSEFLPELLEQNRQTALDLLGGIALSNVLRLPAENLPRNSFLETEAFLENIAFKNGIAITPCSSLGYSKATNTKPIAGNGIEMDFSQLWPVLLTMPFYNLGFVSVDCECCRPTGIFDRNVLPNSRVSCSFTSEGFYFQSMVGAFAENFHATVPLKENRVRIMNEFYLNYVPIGPFKRGQRAELLLCDALKLCDSGKAELVDAKKMHWFCLSNESAVSKELRRINRRIVSLSRQLSLDERNALQKHRLLAHSRLSNNLDFLLKKAFKNTLDGFYRLIPLHLASPGSRFFSPLLAESIDSVIFSTIQRFKDLLEERNARVISSNSQSALIRAENPMSLAKEFSEREKLPLLMSASMKNPQKARKLSI